MQFRFVIILLVSLCFSLNAANYTRFDDIPMLNELPNHEILNLYQDSDGYLWIATTNGLYSFNGYNIQSYKSNIYNFNLLSNNRITCINEDNNKNIIIGTDKGLNILNKPTGRIRHFDNQLISTTYIASIAVTADNEIWIGTDIGLFKYDIKTDTFTRLMSITIKGMYVGYNNDVWIGSWNKGIFRYSQKQRKFINYPRLNSQNSAHTIYEDSNRNIWVGTFGFGITLINNAYDTKKLSYTTFTSKDNGLNDNFIYAITENKKDKSLWIGTRTGVASIKLTNSDTFQSWKNYFPLINNNDILFNEVDAIIYDRQNNLVFGSLGGGICMINANSSDFKVNAMDNVFNQMHTNSVRSIFIDNNNNIWTGIGNKGLIKENATTGEIKIFSNINMYNDNDQFTKIQTITKSKYADIALIGSLNGIYSIDAFGNNIKRVTNNVEDRYATNQIINAIDSGYWIAGNKIAYFLSSDYKKHVILFKDNIKYNSILQSSLNTIWVGSHTDGVTKYTINPTTHKPISKKIYNYAHSCPSTTNVTCLYKDSKGRIWVGTNGAGICLYQPDKDNFISLNLVLNIPTDRIASIAEDKQGNLWLASSVGIIKLTPEDKLEDSKIKIYNESNGLGNYFYMLNSVFSDVKGNIYFGTHHGYVYFNPATVESHNNETKVNITDIKLDNKSIILIDSIERAKITTLTPGYCDKINIPYTYSNLVIDFSSMKIQSSDKVRYAYKLDGYDKDWIYTTSNIHSASYSNLPYGKYTFMVKTTSVNGDWTKSYTSLEIVVVPPFWRTWWAYLIYFFIVSSIIIYIVHLGRQQLRLKTEIKIQQIQKDKDNELTQAKLRFYTNVTHELFTPITIIFAVIQELSSRIPTKELNIITSNTNRLEKLIQQILEFRKSETGNLKLQVSEQDLVSFVDKNVESFIPLMKNKNIELSFIHNEDYINAVFDTDKVNKIIYNLLSNALKYNEKGAKVVVSLTLDIANKHAILSVTDNGKGLSKHTMENLFKRFYDGEFRKFHTQGNGIGLSLVHDLVTLHKGKITVDNKTNEGVSFIVDLPISPTAYEDEEYQESVKSSILDINNSNEHDTSQTNENNQTAVKLKRITLLIVEDETDLNAILVNTLSKDYNICSAFNGKEAIELLSTKDIDLVVSDVMMPEMDGYELCKTIKENTQFNHIPVILLTAKIQEEDSIEAYNNGADSYIKKPFSIKVLKARIANLLARREENIRRFKNDDMFEPKELDYSKVEEEFLTAVMNSINNNYANSDFDQDMLAKDLCVSKSTLNRKIKALTSLSASNIIKDTRLKSAYNLLNKDPNLRISELAYTVGFNDPKYFSTCFKKKFGILPKCVVNPEEEA